MSLPAGSPVSNLFTIRTTPHSGRAVFSTQSIPASTPIFTATDLTLSVLLREYRREVCVQCFAYEHGRDLQIRDQSVGFAFCSPQCREKWRSATGEIGIQAWTTVEKLTKGRGKEDNEMQEMDLPRPREEEIRRVWEGVEQRAALIREARQSERQRLNGAEGVGVGVTKQHRKAIQKALQDTISPDVMAFCVSGILARYTQPTQWPAVLALAPDPTPYHNTADLQAFTRTYLALLAVLPLPLLPLTTPSILRTLSSRDSHNSFGIRSLEDDGSEFFGYGCWPTASYFNHSCEPNVGKRRVGRVWEFRTARDVGEGEELCISYLSGEERALSCGKRMGVLRRNWGFECGCLRCEGVV